MLNTVYLENLKNITSLSFAELAKRVVKVSFRCSGTSISLSIEFYREQEAHELEINQTFRGKQTVTFKSYLILMGTQTYVLAMYLYKQSNFR